MKAAKTPDPFISFRALHLSIRSLLTAALLLSADFAGAQAIELSPSDIRVKPEEKPVSVLQNRYFVKVLRPELGLYGGQMLNEAYTRTGTRGLRLGLFFTESLGLEIQYTDASVSSSDDRKTLNKMRFKSADPEPGEEDKIIGADPEINRIQSMMDASAIFAPFYGKMNMYDWLIVYTDLYLALGPSQVKTDQGTKFAYQYGVGQRFYMFKSLSFRVDFRNHSFVERKSGEDRRRNAQGWDLGVSWFFF